MACGVRLTRRLVGTIPSLFQRHGGSILLGVPAITIRLSETARRDLQVVANRERRDAREQAAILIERALVRATPKGRPTAGSDRAFRPRIASIARGPRRVKTSPEEIPGGYSGTRIVRLARLLDSEHQCGHAQEPVVLDRFEAAVVFAVQEAERVRRDGAAVLTVLRTSDR